MMRDRADRRQSDEEREANQRYVMRWLIFTCSQLMAFGSIAVVFVQGGSVWTSVLLIP